MRTLRLLGLATVLVALAATTASGQSVPSRASHVTGTLASGHAGGLESTCAELDGVYRCREHDIETYGWSDPRLPSERTVVEVYDIYEAADGSGENVVVIATSVTMKDAQGSWTGTGHGIVYPDGRVPIHEVILGHGAYAGLYAVLDCITDSSGQRCEGFIFEGEPPPFPSE